MEVSTNLFLLLDFCFIFSILLRYMLLDMLRGLIGT